MFFLFFCLTLITPPSGEAFIHSQSQQFPHQRSSEMEPDDLAKLVNLPFLSSEKQSFYIHDKNSNGELVGIAYFGTSTKQQIVWYWHPETGFEIVADINKIKERSAVINQFQDNRTTFGFNSKIKINNNGILVGVYQVVRFEHPKSIGYCEWFTWSKNEGLHVISPVYNKLSLCGLNDLDDVLLVDGHTPIIVNVQNPKEARYFYAPMHEMEEEILNWAQKILQMRIRNSLGNKNYSLGCRATQYKLENDSTISGESVFSFYILPSGIPNHTLKVDFKFNEQLKIDYVHISKITCIMCNNGCSLK